MQTSLLGIANKASSNRSYRFRNLFGELTCEHLTHCWKKINQKAAAGVDQMTARRYGRNLSANLQNLVDSVKSQSYRSKWIRRKYIPKPNGKLRPLGIPAIADKVLQAGASTILQAIYEHGEFLPSSYGYRPARSTSDAVKDLTRTLQTGQFHYIVEADIRGFFDNIDHDILLAMLAKRIDDQAFLELIRRWLKAPIQEPDGSVNIPTKGSPQGGIISPVLSNIYLHEALDSWFHDVVKPWCRGKAQIWRYADDFVAAFENGEDAQAFYRVLGKRLKKYELELAPEKTRCLRFSRYDRKQNESFDFLGFSIRWGKSLKGYPCIKKRTSSKKFRAALVEVKKWIGENYWHPKKVWFPILAAKLRGHYQYYGVRGNYERISDFAYQIKTAVFKKLNRRSQRRSYNWTEFNELWAHYNLPKPRICHDF
jgi:RNA-directed DNA polymerase